MSSNVEQGSAVQATSVVRQDVRRTRYELPFRKQLERNMTCDVEKDDGNTEGDNGA